MCAINGSFFYAPLNTFLSVECWATIDARNWRRKVEKTASIQTIKLNLCVRAGSHLTNVQRSDSTILCSVRERRYNSRLAAALVCHTRNIYASKRKWERRREKELIGRKKSSLICGRTGKLFRFSQQNTLHCYCTVRSTYLYINKTLAELRSTNLMYEDEWADDKYIVSHRLAAGA